MFRFSLKRLGSVVQSHGHKRVRTKCTISDHIIPTNGTGGFDLTFLGSGSQGGARRYPSSLAIRLRGASSSHVWIIDAGEGATAQLQRSNMRMNLVRNIFITHMHGDHLFGLPGLVMCVLGRREEFRSRLSPTPQSLLSPTLSSTPPAPLSSISTMPSLSSPSSAPPESATEHSVTHPSDTLHVFGPQGTRAILRSALGVACFRIPARNALYIHELIWPYGCGAPSQRGRHRHARPYWRPSMRPLPFEGNGRDIEASRSSEGKWTYHLLPHCNTTSSNDAFEELNCPASVVAAPVLHTIPTYAYSITENVSSQRFDKTKLGRLGIPKDGRNEVRELFSNWLSGERGIWAGREIKADEVMQSGRSARRLCVVGDTYDASPAAHIAEGVDVLVHEATNMAAQSNMARIRGHSSTIGATAFAKRIGAKRLILNHASIAYSERKIRALENEARGIFGSKNAFVARDLSVFSVPTCEEDRENFVFRRFEGFADSLEFKNEIMNPFSGDFSVDEDDKADGDMEEDEWQGESEDVLKRDDEEDEKFDENRADNSSSEISNRCRIEDDSSLNDDDIVEQKEQESVR